MDDASVMALNVGSPATAVELAHVSQGFWPVRPAWSPNDKQVAYVALDEQAATQHKTVLDLWTAAAGQQPTNHFAFDGLQPEAFYGNHATLCWGVDNRTLIFDSLKPSATGAPQQVELDTVTNKVRVVPKPATPAPIETVTSGAVVVGTQSSGTQTAGSAPASTKCDLAVYSQNDPRWSDEVMQGAGDQIGPFGCALTSTAMVLNYYGANIDPSQLNSCLGSGADLLNWDKAPPCSNGTTQFVSKFDFTWDHLDSILKAGEPAIVGMVRGQTGMHFIVVTGGQGQIAANYSVTDPWDGTTTKTLQTFLNAGYVLRWVIQYSGNTSDCVRTVSASLSSGGPIVTAPADGSVTNDDVTIDVSGDTSNSTVEVVNLSDSTENGGESGGAGSSATPSGSPLAGFARPSSSPSGSPTSIASPTATVQESPTVAGSPTATSEASATPSRARPPIIVNLPLKLTKVPPRLTLTKDGFYLLIVSYHLPDGTPAIQQRTFMIDHTAPTLTVQGQPASAQVQLVSSKPIMPVAESPSNQQFAGIANLQVEAWDAVSGVALVEYSLDGAAWQPYSDDVSFKRTLSIATQGDHVLKARARDVAGNLSNEVEFDFSVLPSTQPEPTATPSATAASGTSSTTPASTSTSSSSGQPGQPGVQVNTDQLDFGDQPVDHASSPLAVTLKNTGTGTLTINGATLSGAAADFSVKSQCPSTLASGSSCSFSVTFKPTVAGTRRATLTVMDNASSGKTSVSLVGTGIKTTQNTPIPVADPEPVDFGSIAIGSKSGTKTVTVSNTGNATLTISSVGLQGSDAGDFTVNANGSGRCSGASVQPGGHCTIDVEFHPTASGLRDAQIVVSHNGPNGKLKVDLNGVATHPAVSLNYTALDFGNVDVGMSITLKVMVKNTGDAALRFDTIAVMGANASVFAIVSNSSTCSGPLDPGKSCVIAVQFTPTAAGSAVASLSMSDNASGSPRQVSLNGTGTQPPAPVISVDPTALDFGQVVIGKMSDTKSLTVTNSGSAALLVTDVSISGDNATDFINTSGNPGGCVANPVAPGQSCIISVQFAPTAAGTRQAQLVISHNAGGSPTIVQLSGVGQAAATPTRTAADARVEVSMTDTYGNHIDPSTPYGLYPNPQTVHVVANASYPSSGLSKIVVEAPGLPMVFIVTGVSASSSNVASFTGTSTTDASGNANFDYTAGGVGDDTVSAFVDINGNGTWDSGEPGATIKVTWAAIIP
jgi:hypothetical protein